MLTVEILLVFSLGRWFSQKLEMTSFSFDAAAGVETEIRSAVKDGIRSQKNIAPPLFFHFICVSISTPFYP